MGEHAFPLTGFVCKEAHVTFGGSVDWSSHPIPVYRDRYRLLKTVQIWTVRFHETSIKLAKFSKSI